MIRRSGQLVARLFFLVVMIVPVIPIGIILKYMSPVGFCECAIAVVIGIFLYVFFIVIEICLIAILSWK